MNHATNAAAMRASNRKLILNLIRQSPISRVELAERAHLTRASITQIVDELIEAGLVETAATVESSALGRRRTQLALCHRARYAFGVNIRRRLCHVGVVDLYGEVFASETVPLVDRTVAQVLDEVAAIIHAQRARLGLTDGQIIGVGASAPGPVDYLSGVILNPPNFEGWHGVSVCGLLAERTGLPCFLEKDTNARALEEKYFGEARALSNFMLVQINDGVGSGVMIHDQLYRGFHGMGTEIGHTSIRFDGPACACGNRGCLENYFHIPTMLAGTGYESWEHLAGCAEEPKAAEVLDCGAEYLAAALVNAINLFDLEQVILAGDVAGCARPLTQRLNGRLVSRVLSKGSVQAEPVIAAASAVPVRTGAMAALHNFFQAG